MIKKQTNETKQRGTKLKPRYLRSWRRLPLPKWVRSVVFWLRYSLFTWLHGNQQTACSSFCVVVVFSFSRVTLSPSSLQLFFSSPLPRIIVIRQNTGWCSVSYDAHTTFLFLGKSNKHYPISYLSFNMLLSVVNILIMESEKDAALTKCSTKCLCITTRF